MARVKEIVSEAEIRFSDGRRYYVANDSVVEFILHPTFLKYLLGCILIYALLDRGASDTGPLEGFQLVLLWAALFFVTIAWYAGVLSLVRWLLIRGTIRMLYTPFLVLPVLALTGTTTYWMVLLMTGTVNTSLLEWAYEVVRDIAVLLVMDMAFGHFVAPLHPSLSTEPRRSAAKGAKPLNDLAPTSGHFASATPAASITVPADHLTSDTENVEPDAVEDKPSAPALVRPTKDTESTSATEGVSDLMHVRNEAVPVQSIIFIQSEDHYIRVVTKDRRFMVRARLSEAMAQLDVRLGLRINRSTWVAYSAISSTSEDESGMLTVTLSSGEVERVSQSRRIAVLATLKMQDRSA